MLKEIGSEFWETEIDNKNQLRQNKNIRYLLSGRTALDYIIKDIIANNKVKIAYLPSYCCHTMIEPFISNGINVEFYDVLLSENNGLEYEIDIEKQCDLIFLIEYFGFANNNITCFAKQFKNKGKIVIEDITHSMLVDNKNYDYVDYIFGSFRKWTSLYSGGFAYKCNEKLLNCYATEQTNDEYVNLRKRASKLKRDYMQNLIENKEYLNLFNQAEMLLDKDYRNYNIDEESLENVKNIDYKFIEEKRIANGKFILEFINKCKIIKPVFKFINEDEVPLFIPIIVERECRDELRKYLINNKIYCPIHWPLSQYHLISEKAKYIYNNMLSLVCDQRYGIDEMVYLEKIIKEFEVEKCF